MPRFEVFMGKGQHKQKWFWHLKASNGRIIADGGEPFVSKSNARRSIATFRRRVRCAKIV